MKDVQCYELFGGIALKDHAFSLFILFPVGLKERIASKQSIWRIGVNTIFVWTDNGLPVTSHDGD